MESEKKNGKIRFGLNLLLYTAAFSKDNLDLIGRVSEMGYDGVELPFTDLDVIDPVETRSALEKAGMGATACAVLVPGANLLSEKSPEREAGISRLKRCVDITAEMGGDAVGGPLYAPVGHITGRGRNNDEWQRAVDGLGTVSEYAARSGIDLAIEPLNRFETYFLNTVQDTAKLIKEIGQPNLKVQLDTFHANIEEKDTAAAVKALGADLGHFHVSESDRGTPGTGQVKWKEIFQALRDIDYRGWMTIESFAKGILELCAAAAIWRDIYKSQDDLATRGLELMKVMRS